MCTRLAKRTNMPNHHILDGIKNVGDIQPLPPRAGVNVVPLFENPKAESGPKLRGVAAMIAHSITSYFVDTPTN